MFKTKKVFVFFLIVILSANLFAADVILNEYNAVANIEFLNGGNLQYDDDGTGASDSYFGRIAGNGGDWFELVVITDHLDMRDWAIQIYFDGVLDETLDITSHSIWSDLRSGTIITVSEDVPSDISYDPSAGDWWINVQANNDADGLYIENSNFAVNSDGWQIVIVDSSDTVVFGPAGEGISPAGGIGDTEIFKLEATPSSAIYANSPDYDDAKKQSTFGAPNQWGIQNLNSLRNVTAAPSTLTLLTGDTDQVIKAGTVYDIQWQSTGVIASVLIEFSVDNGQSWVSVFPANIGNTGSYEWLVPMVDSEQCKVRIASACDLRVYDVTAAAFTIYQCPIDADITGDCEINIDDLAALAMYWLTCENPYNPNCTD